MDSAQVPNAPASTSRRAQSHRRTTEAEDEEARSRKKEEAARRADDTRRDRSGRPGGSRDSPGQYGAARDLGHASGGADARDHERHLVEQPTSFAYQWLRCNLGGNTCVNVANGTQRTYTLVGADAGRTIRVRVTATNADGSANAQSEPTDGDVAPAHVDCRPRGTPERPSIVGTPQVGQQLTADEGSWTGNPTGYAYQWQRCDADVASCAAVIGATGKTYGVRLADLGFRLRVAVTARNARGSATVNSPITADRGACGRDHEPAADDRDHLDPVRRGTRVRALPDLRRLAPERDDPRHGLASARRLRTRAGSRRSCRRAPAASTRGTGCRCCASAARAGTPSRSAPATPRA